MFSWIEALIVALIVGIFGLIVVGPFYTCPAKWERSGLRAEFRFSGGCLVQRKDGTWVPDRAIGYISL